MADMEECFLSGTAAEVTPVSQIGEYEFTPSQASRQLVDAYNDLVNGRISL
jgi:branched-chain amino acid aminotransferase